MALSSQLLLSTRDVTGQGTRDDFRVLVYHCTGDSPDSGDTRRDRSARRAEVSLGGDMITEKQISLLQFLAKEAGVIIQFNNLGIVVHNVSYSSIVSDSMEGYLSTKRQLQDLAKIKKYRESRLE